MDELRDIAPGFDEHQGTSIIIVIPITLQKYHTRATAHDVPLGHHVVHVDRMADHATTQGGHQKQNATFEVVLVSDGNVRLEHDETFSE